MGRLRDGGPSSEISGVTIPRRGRGSGFATDPEYSEPSRRKRRENAKVK